MDWNSILQGIGNMGTKVKESFGQGGTLATGTGNFGGMNPATIEDPTNPGTQVPNDFAGKGSILGMSPNQFSAAAGGLGAALMGKNQNSWQSLVGQFARNLGVAQLGMTANKVKATNDQKMFQELLTKGILNPADISKAMGVHPDLGLNPNSQSSVYKYFGATPPQDEGRSI